MNRIGGECSILHSCKVHSMASDDTCIGFNVHIAPMYAVKSFIELGSIHICCRACCSELSNPIDEYVWNAKQRRCGFFLVRLYFPVMSKAKAPAYSNNDYHFGYLFLFGADTVRCLCPYIFIVYVEVLGTNNKQKSNLKKTHTHTSQ